MRLKSIRSNERNSIAIDWMMRIDRSTLDDAERAELDAWLNADSLNRGAFLRAQAMWSRVRHLAARDEARSLSLRTPRLFVRPRLAAAIAALMVATGWGIVAAHGYFAGREVADLGEIRRFALADGSTMILNTNSAAQVRFGEHERRIVMQRGEASFVVAKHDRRPFLVQARDVSVRAVGTMFTVRMRPANVAVTVKEGVVDVARTAQGERPAERYRAVANLQLTVSDQRPMQKTELDHEDVSRQLSWQQGLLIFDGDRLQSAMDEVNRYSALKVVIDAPALLDQPFVGVFRTGDTRAFAYTVAALFNARVIEAIDDDTLRITTAPERIGESSNAVRTDAPLPTGGF